MNDFVADMRQRLVQLNRLEEQVGESLRRRDRNLDDEALIESLRANISLTVLLHHDRLRARGRRSVAEVRNSVCSGCHIALPVGTVASLKHQIELLKCHNCARYIFLAEDESARAPTPKLRRSGASRSAQKLDEIR